MNYIKRNHHKYLVALSMALFLLMASSTLAQTVPLPKWGSKAKKAIVSVLTYDQNGNLLKSGTGFYVTTDGVALADYTLFKGAYTAFVVDASGTRIPVERILGADDTYSVVRFKVKTKKNATLTLSRSIPSIGGLIFALNYSEGKTSTCPSAQIAAVTTVADSCQYYTLSDSIGGAYLSAPVFNTEGEVVGMVQPSMGTNGYALGIKFIESLKIGAITSRVKSMALESINMPKGLPDSAEESLVYLYMKSGSLSNEVYLDLLNLFVESYPDNPEGYIRRATLYIDLHRFEESDQDMQAYYRLSKEKAQANSRIAEVIYTKLLYQPTPAYEKWNYDLAIRHVDEALAADADNLSYKLQKAQILMAQKDYQGALALYDAINKSDDRSPGTFFAACLAHEGLGDSLSIQIELLDSALALFPTPMPADAAQYVLRRGQLYSAKGKYREAVVDYNQYCFLVNHKVNVSFYYDRAKLELKARMYQQALDDLTTAINMSPETPILYVEKSVLLLQVNELDECIVTAQKLLSFDEKNMDGLRILGYAQIQKGDKTTGLSNLQKAADLGDETAKELIGKMK